MCLGGSLSYGVWVAKNYMWRWFGPCGQSSGSAGSSQRSNGSVEFSLGLGQSSRGEPFGTLAFKRQDLSEGYGPDGLQYEPRPLCERVNSVAGDTASPIKQVLTPQCLAHVENLTAGGFEVRFFERTKVGAKVNGVYQVTGGYGSANAYAVWRFSDPGPDGQSRPRALLEELRNGSVAGQTYWTHEALGSDTFWEMDEGGGKRIDRKTQVHGPNDGDVDILRTVSTRVNNVEVLISEDRQSFLGGRIVSQTRGPIADGESTQWHYDANGLPDWQKHSDGSWEMYGRVATGDEIGWQYIVRPTGDLPFAQGTTTTGAVEWISTDSPGLDTVSKVDGVKVGETMVQVDEEAISVDGFAYALRVQTSLRYLRPGVSVATTTKTFIDSPGSPNFRADRPYLEEESSGLRREYAYEQGQIDAAGAFTPGGALNCVRQTVSESDTNSGSVVGNSHRRATIYDAEERAVVEEDYLCTAANTFSLLSRTMHSFDAQGRLTGTARDGRTLFETQYDAAGHQLWVLDETGVRTEFSNWDWAGRAQQVVRKGFVGAGADAPAQPDRTTVYTFDAEGRTVVENVNGGQLVSTWEYDTAGRLRKESVNGVETGNSYSSDLQTGGKIVTKTTPGGLQEITRYYLDGRVKSVTGSAVVATAYSYGVQNAGEPNYTDMLWERVDRGVDTPLAAGGIWSKTVKDWLGNPLLEESQRPGSPATIRREMTYQPNGEVMDEFVNGVLVKGSWRDMASNSNTITSFLSATDSVVEAQTITVEQIGANWYLVQAGASGTAKEQLSGLGGAGPLGSLTAHTLTFDA